MAITYPLASPTGWGVAAVTWGGVSNSVRSKTPWTLHDIVQVYEGAMWVGTLSFVSLDEADGRALSAWITALEGVRGTFLLGDPSATAPLGSAKDTPGTPVVDGAGQTGRALNIRGAAVSASGYLLAGDYFQLGSGATARLYKVLEAVTTDISGDAALTIWPAIETAPADGATITLSSPQGVFALSENSNPWDVQAGRVYDGISLSVASVMP